MRQVLILGAGFAGLELASGLAEAVPDQVRVTLIDQNDSFVFGFAKLDVMFGHADPQDVKLSYRTIDSPTVRFRQERIVAIDPAQRRVRTDRDSYDADVLVVALGADLDPDATPGLVDGGYEFYSLAGARRLRNALADFRSGAVLIAVLGPFFKCPPAPIEAALLLHDYLSAQHLREAVSIRVLSPMPAPVPPSPDTSAALLAALGERGIEFWPQSVVARLDAAQHRAWLRDGRSLACDLLLGIPVHRAPAVVDESGLTVDGWIPVDPVSFQTRFENVYAIGDVTSMPVPRAGVFAEGEARVLARRLAAEITGDAPPPPYQGIGSCYIEFGADLVARVDMNFLTRPAPFGQFNPPSAELTAEKRLFAATRRRRWFGT
jgi:sulfide:quinone oxidoreductase